MRKTHPAFRYALAVAAAIVALLLRQLLAPLYGNQNPYHTVWLAVVFSAWYCGLGPSVVTTLLSTLGVWYWFLPSTHSFALQDRTEAFGLLGFVAFSAGIIALGESNRRGTIVKSKLVAIVESSADAIISQDLDGNITSWNGAAERLFGYTSAEAIGQHMAIVVPSDRREEGTRILEQLRRGERVGHFETTRARKDGTKCDVSLTISPLTDVGGHVVGASTVVRDISERTQTERAKGLLASIVDSSEDAIVSKNLEGIITTWNSGAASLWLHT